MNIRSLFVLIRVHPMNIAIDIRSLMETKKSGVAEYTFNLIDNLLKIDSENHHSAAGIIQRG